MKRTQHTFFGFLLLFALPLQGAVKSGTISKSEAWTKADSPVVVEADVTVPAGVAVTVEPGVQVQINTGISITVQGRFDAEGTAAEPVVIGPKTSSRWKVISYEGQGTGTYRNCLVSRGSTGSGDRHGMISVTRCTGAVLIEDCSFTDWPDDLNSKAVSAYHSTNVAVRRSWFGPGENECIYTDDTPVLVEYNTFEPRTEYRDSVDVGNIVLPKPRPVIRYNVFLGSEDDSIDLDRCDAWVEGNWVFNCRGGTHDPIGISGDNQSRPVIINNVVINCENGIGFKNGADITVINNTIINCDRGFFMHVKAENGGSGSPSHAKVYNTIVWGKENQQSVYLDPGCTAEISYSIVRGATVYPGAGNTNLDPKFVDLDNQIYTLRSDSPAIDAGFGFDLTPATDFFGKPRIDIAGMINSGQGTPAYVDIGAYEFQPDPARIREWLLQ